MTNEASEATRQPLGDVTNHNFSSIVNKQTSSKAADERFETDLKNLSLQSAGGLNKEQKVKAAEIRRQVEYYFSDENLLRDKYLYGRMKGSKAKPVPVELVHAFKKMVDFQPYSFVVDSLRTSQTLSIVEYGERSCIVRKKPFSRHDFQSPGTPKPLSSTRATGFEEYYADPPMTPQEAEENEEMYSPDQSFPERIELAMQMFRARRTFQARNADIWTKFAKYGGVTTGPSQFTGSRLKEDMEDLTKAEKVRLTAQEWLDSEKYDTGPDGKWAVDFSGVAKGFLSSIVPDYYSASSEQEIHQITNVIRNFYNYILYHNVCPEYRDDINDARRTCDMANEQLLGVHRMMNEFPGDVNTACLVLFGGADAQCVAESSWAGDNNITTNMPTLQRAKQTFSLAAAANAPDEWFTKDKARIQQSLLDSQQVLATETRAGFEVVEIKLPNDDAHEMYESYDRRFKVVGKLICKPWKAPLIGYRMDLPKAYKDDARSGIYEFWLEQELLEHCVVGTKFIATVKTLSTGLHIIEGVSNAYPSFYAPLLNELLYAPGSSRKWKEPVETTREEHLEKEARYKGQEESTQAVDEVAATEQGLPESTETTT